MREGQETEEATVIENLVGIVVGHRVAIVIDVETLEVKAVTVVIVKAETTTGILTGTASVIGIWIVLVIQGVGVDQDLDQKNAQGIMIGTGVMIGDEFLATSMQEIQDSRSKEH